MRRTGIIGVALLALTIGATAPAAAQVQDVTETVVGNVSLRATSPASHDKLGVSFTFAREDNAIAASTDEFRIWYGTARVTTGTGWACRI